MAFYAVLMHRVDPVRISGGIAGEIRAKVFQMRAAMREKRRYFRRGVMTVEASVIFPMMFVIVILLITCLFCRHNENYYTAAAAETALRGNAASEGGEENGGQLMTELAETRTGGQPMPGTLPEYRGTSGEWGSAASFRGQKFPVFREYFSWEAEVSVPKIHPAEQIRKRWCGLH